MIIKQKKKKPVNIYFMNNVVSGSLFCWKETTNISIGEVLSYENKNLKIKCFGDYPETDSIIEFFIYDSGDVIKYENGSTNKLDINYVFRYFTFYNENKKKKEFLEKIQNELCENYNKTLKKLEYLEIEKNKICNMILKIK